MIKKILIIGGNGFLGTNIAQRLKDKNFKITLLCRTKIIDKNLKKFNYLFCDIKNFSKLKKVINDDFDCVINLSGNINHNNKNEVFTTHYKGLKNLIDVIKEKKIKLFIQSGSSLEYGKKFSPQKETKICRPISYYGKAKYLASNYIIKKKLSLEERWVT